MKKLEKIMQENQNVQIWYDGCFQVCISGACDIQKSGYTLAAAVNSAYRAYTDWKKETGFVVYN